MSRICLEAVWKLPGSCLDGVRKVSGRCREVVWKVSRRCLGVVGKVLGWHQEGFGKASEIFFRPFFWTGIITYTCQVFRLNLVLPKEELEVESAQSNLFIASIRFSKKIRPLSLLCYLLRRIE